VKFNQEVGGGAFKPASLFFNFELRSHMVSWGDQFVARTQQSNAVRQRRRERQRAISVNGLSSLNKQEARNELRARSLALTEGRNPVEEVGRAIVFDLYADARQQWSPRSGETLQINFEYRFSRTVSAPSPFLVSSSQQVASPLAGSAQASSSSNFLAAAGEEQSEAQQREAERQEQQKRLALYQARGLRVRARQTQVQAREICRLSNLADFDSEDE